MALSFLLLYMLFSGLSHPEDLNMDHFRCKLWRRLPQYGQGPHTLWLHFFMGCTYGTVHRTPKTRSINRIICSVKGHRNVIPEVNPDFNPYLGYGFWSVMFNIKGKFRLNCEQQLLKCCHKPDCLENRKSKKMLKRNMVLTIKKQIQMKKMKEATKVLQFKKVPVRKQLDKQVFPQIHGKDSLTLLPETPKKLQNKIHSVGLNKYLIKLVAPLTQSETKMTATAIMLNKCKTCQETTQIQAKGHSDPQKVQTTKTMFLLEKLVSKRKGIKVKSMQTMAGNTQKGIASNSTKDVSKASKIRQLFKHNIVLDYNMKNKTAITPSLVSTSTPLQKIKSAADNSEMYRAAIIKDFKSEWDSRPKTSTKTERETDPELTYLTKKQTIKPQSTFQTLGLRMREESPDGKTVEEEEKEFIPIWRTFAEEVEPKTAGDNLLCKGLIHQTEAGLMHCRDRLEKWNRKSLHGLLSSRKPESLHTVESDGAENHFYFFDGVLKKVKNNHLNQQY